MKIVISGSGEVGFHLADQLVTSHQDVVLIEKDPYRAKFVADHLDCMVITGEGSNPEVLAEAGIDGADTFIAVSNLDEVNIVSCLVVANEFKVKTKIARVRSLQYRRSGILKHSLLGIDYVVNPEIEAARAIMNIVAHGATGEVLVFEDTDIQLRNIFVDEASPFKDMTLREIRKEISYNFIIAGISRDDEVIIPYGDTKIAEGDRVYLVSSTHNMERILARTGRFRHKLHNVVVVGGGKIGCYVTEFLLGTGRSVKLVEKDYKHCKYLAERFSEALVINEDISDEKLFEDEQLNASDLIVITTHDEALNMLTAIYAKSLGVKRVVPVVNKSNYLNIANKLGIDATVSPKASSVSAILKYVRRGNIKRVHSIFEGKAEAIEFAINPASKMDGKRVKDLHLPAGSLVVAVNRPEGASSKNFVPNGEFVIQAGDNVVTFAKAEQVDSLEELFMR
ncbi:MAG: Trk system potassium transporter TrkA [Deltaproteobacteria bacterium]|nr:Trk system potassium transporter TrkA [Candidatus Tharpella aukensis]